MRTDSWERVGEAHRVDKSLPTCHDQDPHMIGITFVDA